MKFLLWLTVSNLIVVTAVVGQKRETGSALKSMVETEQAFSKTAEEQGTREAFLQFIADDGILFRPTAVRGKQWLRDHPQPLSQKRSLLAWQPVFAYIARAGDLGYTTGPWEFTGDIKDEKPAAYGDFVTLWKKQADGSWKFVLDLGISHPQSSGPLKLWRLSDEVSSGTEGGNINLEPARSALVERDREFANTALKQGFAKSFLSYATSDVRLFREDNNPFVGMQAAAQALSSGKGLVTWQPSSGDVSRSGDLGYTYGTYDTHSDDGTKKIIEHGSYLRIWKQENGLWKIVLDVAHPQPPG